MLCVCRSLRRLVLAVVTAMGLRWDDNDDASDDDDDDDDDTCTTCEQATNRYVLCTNSTYCRDYCYLCFSAVATHRRRQPFLHVHAFALLLSAFLRVFYTFYSNMTYAMRLWRVDTTTEQYRTISFTYNVNIRVKSDHFYHLYTTSTTTTATSAIYY